MISILVIYLPAVLLPLILLVPAAIISLRKPEPDSWMLAMVHVPAVTLWIGLVVSGYGAQSLGNLCEGFVIGAAAVVFAYVKVFVIDRYMENHALTSYALAGVLGLLAVGLRTFMPVLPE
jgi:hypothetical protein